MLPIKYFYYPLPIKEYIKTKIKETPELNENRHLDKLLYIIHLLYWAKYQSPTYYEQRGVTVNTRVLKKAIGEPNYNTLLHALIQWELIIKFSDSYQTGEYSKCYKLHPNIEELPINRTPHTPARVDSWLNKIGNKTVTIKQQASIEQYQLNIINQLTFSPELNLYVKEKYPGTNINAEHGLINAPIPRKLFGVFTMLDREYFCIRRPFNNSRLYSNVVSLKREIRAYLLLHGKHLQQLDIKNAQIFLGYFIIRDYLQNKSEGRILENEYPDDVTLFKELAMSGRFYEYLAEQAGECIATPEERETFKKAFFKFVWYAELAWYCNNHKLNQVFRKCFPTVTAIIEEIKHPNHSIFPVMLQDLEAKIILDIVGKELMNRNILFLTIHDAVLVNNEKDCSIVKQILEDAFMAELGEIPSIDVKDYQLVK